MAYAAWTKGSSALLLAARALARASGVERTLLAEWSLSQPALGRAVGGRRLGGGRQGLALGRRDGGDRRLDGRGRPAAGFHEAAADIYDRASQAAGTPTTRRPAPEPPASTLDTVISGLM